MNNGFTIEPQLTIDPATGEEVLNYDQAVVHDHSFKEAANRQHQEDQKYAIQEDNAGNRHHAWDVENPEQYDEDGYYQQVEEDESDDYYTEEQISSFIDEVYDIAGGQDGYAEMIAHARETWNDEDIERFNAVMDSENLQLMSAAIQFLIEDWNEMVEEQQELNYWSR